MARKRWMRYINDIFDGYAPNREKARRWCCNNIGTSMLMADHKRLIIVVQHNNTYKAEYKQIDQ